MELDTSCMILDLAHLLLLDWTRIETPLFTKR